MLERLAFRDELGQDLYFLLRTEECRDLVIWGSFVDYVPVFPVYLEFEYYMLACLEFCAIWTSDRPLYVVCLVVFSEVAMSSPSL